MNHRAPDYGSMNTAGWLVGAMKLVAMLALLLDRHPPALVAGARSRGLIYNRDGKFIYRPARANQGHIIVIDDRQRDGANSPPLDRATAGSSGWPMAMEPQPMGSMYRAYSLMNLHQPSMGLYGGGGGPSYAAIPAPSQPHIQLIALADPRFVAAASGLRLATLKPTPAAAFQQQPVALLRAHTTQLAARPTSGLVTHETGAAAAPAVLQIIQPASTGAGLNYAAGGRAFLGQQQQFPVGQYQSLADLEFISQQQQQPASLNSRLLETQQVELSRTLPERLQSTHDSADLLNPMEEVAAPWNEVFEEPLSQQRRPGQPQPHSPSFSGSRLSPLMKSAFEPGSSVQPEVASMDELWPSDQPSSHAGGASSQAVSDLASHHQQAEHNLPEHNNQPQDITQQLLEKAGSTAFYRKSAPTSNKYQHHTPEQHSFDSWSAPPQPYKPRKQHHRHKTMAQESIHHHLRPAINFNSHSTDKNANYWKKFRHQFEFV